MNFLKRYIISTFISVCSLLSCAPKSNAIWAEFGSFGKFYNIASILQFSKHSEYYPEEYSKIDSIEKIEELFKDIDLHDKNESGQTVLHVAAACGSKLALEWLVSHGADVNVQDDWGCSALHFATQRGNVEEMKFLLDNGANIDIKDKQGDTALFYCTDGKPTLNFCFNDRDVSVQETMKILLECGANVTIQNNYGNTPMHRYCYYSDKIFLLRAYGADREIKNKDGDTLLHYFARNYSNALKFMGDFMSNEPSSDTEYLNIKNNDGNTPLHLAAEGGGFEYVKYLLERNADKTIKNKDGDTPLQLSSKHIRDNGCGHEWRYEKVRELLDENFKSAEYYKKLAIARYREALTKCSG